MRASAATTPGLDDRISLRPFEAGDLDELVAAIAPEPDARAGGLPRPATARGARAWCARVREERDDGAALVLVARAPGRGVVGTTRLYAIDAAARTASLSYWIAAPHRGRGYGAAAARRTVAFAFGPAGLIALHASTFEDNGASRALLARLGFRRAGAVARARPAGGGPLGRALLHVLTAPGDTTVGAARAGCGASWR